MTNLDKIYRSTTKHISIIFMLSMTTYENKVKEYNNVTD